MGNLPNYIKDHYKLELIRRYLIINNFNDTKTIESIRKDIFFRLKNILDLDGNLRLKVL